MKRIRGEKIERRIMRWTIFVFRGRHFWRNLLDTLCRLVLCTCTRRREKKNCTEKHAFARQIRMSEKVNECRGNVWCVRGCVCVCFYGRRSYSEKSWKLMQIFHLYVDFTSFGTPVYRLRIELILLFFVKSVHVRRQTCFGM